MSQIKNPMQIILKSHTGQQQPVIHRACSSQSSAPNSKPVLINQHQQQHQANLASGHGQASPIGSSIKEERADDKRQHGDAGHRESSAQLLMSPSAIRPVIQTKTTTTPIATSSREHPAQANHCATNASTPTTSNSSSSGSSSGSTNKGIGSTPLTRTAIVSASPTSKQRSTAHHSSSTITATTTTTTTTTTSAATATATASGSGSGSGSPPGDSGNVAVTARLLDMGKRLLDAAREGQTDQVRQLVESSGAPFTSDWLGTTALHLAAQHGHAEIADILLKGGVNRDARTKLERTALHLAAQSGSLQVVESLLIYGSDINARDMLKMTPLHWAVERRHIDIVERLIIGGADLNAKSKFQLTPLDIARNSNSYDIVELFKNWTHKDNIDLGVYDNKFYESHDILDVNYHQLMMAENAAAAAAAATNRTSMLDIDEPCIDLVELEWNSLKFETDFLRSGHNDVNRGEQKPSCELDCLMKMVEELQKENEQLKRRLEQMSSPFAR